jgi:hypothetical protein
MTTKILDLDDSSFKTYPFRGQTVDANGRQSRHADNYFVAAKMPSDCGIICIHGFSPLTNVWEYYKKDQERKDRAVENYKKEMTEQLLSFCNEPTLMWNPALMGSSYVEKAGMVFASLTQTQAYGSPGLPLYVPLEPILLDCGFFPLMTAKNGNSTNDVRLYGRVFNKCKHTWMTEDERQTFERLSTLEELRSSQDWGPKD